MNEKPSDAVQLKRFPEYWATPDGRIWSEVKKRFLKGHWQAGYHEVNLRLNGKGHHIRTHQLICEAFTGEKSTRHKPVRHLDGNKRNNHISNLRIGTMKENAEDAVRHGTQARGERQHLSKLTVCKVKAIRLLAAYKVPKARIAEIFSVTPENIAFVIQRKTWKHVL